MRKIWFEVENFVAIMQTEDSEIVGGVISYQKNLVQSRCMTDFYTNEQPEKSEMEGLVSENQEMA